ncbi:MAG: hypothetical protein ACREQN_09300, partial [Candidatus Binataceae bacterium]
MIETSDRSLMSDPYDYAVERWMVNGKVVDICGVANCPAIMGDHFRTYTPQRWEEVPRSVYDPIERLKILDSDGVGAEVLFPNQPVQNATFSNERRFDRVARESREKVLWRNREAVPASRDAYADAAADGQCTVARRGKSGAFF